MNKRKILALGIILVLSLSVIAFADNHVAKVEAYLAGDLNFNVDGEQWEPKDVDGSNLTPIIYESRTYIPVRSLLEDKGVTVDYKADSKTVLIDYSTMNVMKPIDKASPLLMTSVMSRDDDSDGDGIDDGTEYKELTLKKNPNFNLQSIEMTQEMSLNLSDSTKIVIDGKRNEMSLDELMAAKTSWDTESAVFTINEKTGEVEKMSISTVSSDSTAALDIHVDITVSYPPWKVTITISW